MSELPRAHRPERQEPVRALPPAPPADPTDVRSATPTHAGPVTLSELMTKTRARNSALKASAGFAARSFDRSTSGVLSGTERTQASP